MGFRVEGVTGASLTSDCMHVAAFRGGGGEGWEQGFGRKMLAYCDSFKPGAKLEYERAGLQKGE